MQLQRILYVPFDNGMRLRTGDFRTRLAKHVKTCHRGRIDVAGCAGCRELLEKCGVEVRPEPLPEPVNVSMEVAKENKAA